MKKLESPNFWIILITYYCLQSEDLLSSPETYRMFTHADVIDVVQLTVDIPRNQLLVGARGVIIRLDLHNLTNLETVQWKAPDDTRILCESKGQSSADDIANVTKTIRDGVGLSPFDPNHNSTGIITSHGDYISGTVVDITARDPVIYRALSPGNRPNLRTLDNSKWLNEPDFVSAYEIEDYVYFFFREVAVEYINCGKRRYSRIARVCKNDEGGKLLLENGWTTFFKSRLNCSIPGEYPFYFDEIQNTFLLEHNNETYLYAVFTTPDHALPGSAVCIYKMAQINASFEGPFKYQESSKKAWERQPNTLAQKECKQDVDTNKRSQGDSDLNLAAQQMITSQKYQMMDEAVQPMDTMPYVLGLNDRWTHVVADHVEGKNGMYKVIFVATIDGKIKKMVHLPNKTESCLIEEVKIVPNGEFNPVKKMTLSKQHGAIYVSTKEKIIKIPLHRCERFLDSDLCVNSMDPYCGWDDTMKKCTARPYNGQSSMLFWQQAMTSCPSVEHPGKCSVIQKMKWGQTRIMDGNWSEWSPWKQCQQAGSDITMGDCYCRIRTCDNPPKLYGGNDCTGPSIEVVNCTVHGQWTEWTQWTACSASCGPNGTRTRVRHCSPPKYGGRPCDGKAQEEGFCIGNPSCPEPPINGNWSPWSPWTDCTTNCGGGIQSRRRACVSPAPSKDGIPCIGNKQEWRMCNMHMCPEEALNISQDGDWSEWTSWSSCSYPCGGGTQWRKRSCDNPQPIGFGKNCEGLTMEERDCNTHTCKGEWGCWSEYSACTVTCGTGYKTRTRRCDVPGYTESLIELCVGLKEETSLCYMDPCNETTDGWDLWATWTPCGVDGVQYRHRSCHVPAPSPNQCQGHSVQFQTCIRGEYDIRLQPVMSASLEDRYNYTLFHLTLVSCAAFFMGVVLSVGVYLCYYSCRNLRKTKFEVDKNRKRHLKNHVDKRKYGSFASQCSIEFLSVNNKIYDSSTLSSRGTAVVRDGTFNRDKYMAGKDKFGTIRTNISLRTEV
ncbi:hypothetical protein FSP39_009544 [Pinctada imbricata]|uniref:Sema domain-containing protein n=1 Tax=Pinctada imbricata TaxID=66713 RepID=A0AA88YUN9_PINIB|nr:hypothetical protein FSP39_009544 [Pinctada imbricata]